MNYTLNNVIKHEILGYNNNSHENWEKAVEIIEKLYQNDNTNVFVVIRRIFLYCYLFYEYDPVGYKAPTDKRIWLHKEYIRTYRKTKEIFESNAFYLWIVAYLMDLRPATFLENNETDDSIYEEKSIEYIKKAMQIEPENPLIPITLLEVAKDLDIKLDKQEAIELIRFCNSYFENQGVLGISLSYHISFNIYLIYNNYKNPLIGSNYLEEREKYSEFLNLADLLNKR